MPALLCEACVCVCVCVVDVWCVVCGCVSCLGDGGAYFASSHRQSWQHERSAAAPARFLKKPSSFVTFHRLEFIDPLF